MGVAAIGAIGVLLAAWTLADARTGARVAHRLGLRRLADHWDDILSLLAVPALMFFVVLMAWALLELLRLHRTANDPDHYRQRRSLARGQPGGASAPASRTGSHVASRPGSSRLPGAAPGRRRR